ncbi:lysophospholipid acyltransferase family protein [Stigmatella sp. ncwal1]|uniref:Lysophospholipid acyltransferase family protein n=1 Tax=Stigmatella ashevillensis TaxID=2995309 RepID=A0ABT5D4N2_9BACT|nr:lysophospholipid acyltransferase family protein [Stigmatella ashevillena]MDC0707793.1 lysophospholipid acyltransferase family protein [Stigmatella ashevillena]
MATKGVLGNDPFQRGAARRSTEPQSASSAEPPKKAAPARSKPKTPGAAKKAAPAKAPPPKAAQPPKAPPPKAPKPPKERKPARPAAVAAEFPKSLREPAPSQPSRRSSARGSKGVARPEDAAAREQAVDEVMATAAAEEATQAAAEAAAETAVATLLTLGAQQASAGAAPEPNSLEATWNRELATAVVAEAAEAAAEAVLGVALSSASTPLTPEEGPLDSAEGSLETAPAVNASSPGDEAEVPDTQEDEFPPARKAPLSLVPSLDSADAAEAEASQESGASEPLPSEQVGATPTPGSMLSLAKEIALQALSSASVSKTLEAAQGVVNALRAGLGTAGSTSLDEYGRDAELVSELQPLMDFLYERYWRVTLQSVEWIPAGGAILVANHSGALPFDGLVATQAILRERPELREPRWLVEDQVFHAPVLGTIFNRLGAVRACPENALRLLDEQRPVLVFPEGYQGLSKPFAQRYQLKRFGRGGFVKLALRTGAPIIPVAIVGSEETSPLLGRIPAGFLGVPYLPLTGPVPLPAKWTLRFGEPISMDGLSQDAANDLAEVQRLTERTREAIQSMIQALLRERRSVFAG